MTIITIPKKLTKDGDLIVLPRKEYEKLLERSIPVTHLTAKEKKAVERGRKELKRGDFVTLVDLQHELRGSRSQKR
ncbi:MAG: hypothetical protein HYT12_02345 [Candidatus Liptonbacteria bacterium]|nr:hypothetical protein [Candidatus Liptonbacteria bacterium]